MTKIFAISVFVENLPATKTWYETVFAVKVVYEDDVSCSYGFEGTLINLLQVSEAAALIAPAPVGDASAGRRMQYTVNLDTLADLDAKVAELAAAGIELLNGPIDRPWGIRTIALADPAGHVWEFAAPLEAA
jgi:uncharacterized glyoxalase superfamily protein PhnB